MFKSSTLLQLYKIEDGKHGKLIMKMIKRM